MKTKHFLPLGIMLLITACFGSKSPEQPTIVAGDTNTALTASANGLTDAVFKAGAPELNALTSKLPADTQALAQAGYAALLRATESAESKGIANLPASEQQDALQGLSELNKITDALHTALHLDPNSTK